MSDKPHSLAIGAFVTGAALIALVAALYLAGASFGSKEKIVMVFDGSVKGLNVGAPVALRGVQVGQVTNIKVVLDSETADLIMIVEADFDSKNIHLRGKASEDLTEELLQRGLRAQLNTQSILTGLLYVQLDFFPNSELKLAKLDSPYFQFPTIPTDLERITRKLQDLDFSLLIDNLNNIANSTSALVSNADLQSMPQNVNATLESLRSLSDGLKVQLDSSGPKLDAVLDETATTMSSANTELPKLAELVESNLKVLDDAVITFEQTLSSVDGLVSADSATVYQLNQALKELTRAGKSLQSLANTLEEQPEALIRGKSVEE